MLLEGNVNIRLWAILLGANDSLIRLALPYGYKLKKLKLNETPICDMVTDGTGKLGVKYLASNLASVIEPEFIFLYKETNDSVPIDFFTGIEMMNGNQKADLYFDDLVGNQRVEVFRILALLRLMQEGNIEVSDGFFAIHANCGVNNIVREKTFSQDNPLGVYDDLYEWDVANVNCFQNMISLPQTLTEELEDVYERFGRGYSASRFDDAYKNLVTLAEIILIGYNSSDQRGGKKEKFSNRIAAAIASDVDAQSVHDIAMQMYKERSNETHEGKNQNITKEELKNLRCMVRKMIIHFIDFCRIHYGSITDKSFQGLKKTYILSLLSRIDTLQSNGYLH